MKKIVLLGLLLLGLGALPPALSAQPWTPPISVNGGTSFFTSQGQIASQDVIFEVDFGATAFARTLEFTITCNTNAGIEISLCDTDRSAAATSIAEWVAANPILRLQGSTLPAGGGSIAINYVTPAYSGRHRFCYTIQPDQSLAGGTWTPTFPCGFTISVNDISAGAPGPSVPYQLVGDWDQALPAATIGSTTNVFSEVWSGGVAVGNGNLNAAADQLQFDYEVNFGAASNTCTLGMIAYVATTSTGAGSTTFEFYDLQNDGGQTPTFTLSTTVGAAAFQTRTTASLTGLQRFRVIVKLGTGSTPSSNMFFQVTFGTVNPGTTAANRALTVIAPPVTPPIIYTPTAPTTKVTVTPAGTTGAPVAGAPAPASGASWTSTNNFSATGGKEAGNYAWTIQSVTPITGGAPAWTGLAMTASPTASGIATNITGTAPTVTGPSTYRIVLRATRGFEWGETVIDVTVGGAAGTPTLTVNPTGTITVPTTTAGTAGTAASFTVSGSNLTPASGNVTLALTSTPAGIQFRNATAAGTFGTGNIVIAYTGGAFAAQTIEVRFASTATAGSYTGSIAITGGGATAVNVPLSGTVNATGTPTLTVVPGGTLTVPTATAGTAGTAASFTVSGSNLTPASGNVTLALTSTPAGIEFRNATAAGTFGTTNIVIAYTGGAFAAQTIEVRFASTATAGSYTGSIAITGGGATAVNVPLSGTVNAAGGTLNITTGTLPNGVVGTPYNATITSTGGTGTHSWTVSAGSLPPGLSLTGGTAATTSISGTPTTAGTFNFTIQVTAGAQTDTQAYSVTVTTSGGGTGTIGGGGGGGGCSVEGGVSPWYLLAGLASLAVLALRRRRQAA